MLTEMIYAMAKNVARPARISVKNLACSRAFKCPDPWSRNLLPIILLATASLIFLEIPIFSSVSCTSVVDGISRYARGKNVFHQVDLIDTRLETLISKIFGFEVSICSNVDWPMMPSRPDLSYSWLLDLEANDGS